MPSTTTPRTPAPERPPPPVPPPPIEPPPRDASPAAEEFHTPTPSFEASPREEASPVVEEEGGGGGGSSTHGGAATANSPKLSPMRFPSPNSLPPPGSPADSNGHERLDAAPAPAGRARPELRLATGLLRTPSQGSLAAKSPSPSPPSPLTPAPPIKSPSPSPPSPLTPALAAAKSTFPSPPTPAPGAKSPSPSPPSPLTPAPPVNNGKSASKRGEAWKPPPPPTVAPPPPFDPDEEAVSSPLTPIGKPRLDQQRRMPVAAENGRAGPAAVVPPDVEAVAMVGDRRALSVALRLATAVLSLAAFSVMVSARTSGWAGDYFGRHEEYRYAVGVNVVVCAYSIAQCFGETRHLFSPRLIFRSTSSYYFSLFLDQALAYLLMSASSAAASRHDLWVSRFGTDAFNKKINSAVWLSFIAFLTLAANALISTANLFSMV